MSYSQANSSSPVHCLTPCSRENNLSPYEIADFSDSVQKAEDEAEENIIEQEYTAAVKMYNNAVKRTRIAEKRRDSLKEQLASLHSLKIVINYSFQDLATYLIKIEGIQNKEGAEYDEVMLTNAVYQNMLNRELTIKHNFHFNIANLRENIKALNLKFEKTIDLYHNALLLQQKTVINSKSFNMLYHHNSAKANSRIDIKQHKISQIQGENIKKDQILCESYNCIEYDEIKFIKMQKRITWLKSLNTKYSKIAHELEQSLANWKQKLSTVKMSGLMSYEDIRQKIKSNRNEAATLKQDIIKYLLELAEDIEKSKKLESVKNKNALSSLESKEIIEANINESEELRNVNHQLFRSERLLTRSQCEIQSYQNGLLGLISKWLIAGLPKMYVNIQIPSILELNRSGNTLNATSILIVSIRKIIDSFIWHVMRTYNQIWKSKIETTFDSGNPIIKILIESTCTMYDVYLMMLSFKDLKADNKKNSLIRRSSLYHDSGSLQKPDLINKYIVALPNLKDVKPIPILKKSVEQLSSKKRDKRITINNMAAVSNFKETLKESVAKEHVKEEFRPITKDKKRSLPYDFLLFPNYNSNDGVFEEICKEYDVFMNNKLKYDYDEPSKCKQTNEETAKSKNKLPYHANKILQARNGDTLPPSISKYSKIDTMSFDGRILTLGSLKNTMKHRYYWQTGKYPKYVQPHKIKSLSNSDIDVAKLRSQFSINCLYKGECKNIV